MASKSPSNYHHNHQHKHNQLQQMPNGSSSLTPVEQLFRHFDSMSEAELREQLARENLDTRGTTRQLLMRLRQHYRTALVEIRKRCPNRARTANFYDYFVVIDFECSCDKDNYDYEHEIIEFPAVLVGVQTRKIVDTFHTFVRPTGNPRLTEFCTNLTGITQETVDRSPEFPQALDAFRRWLTAHGLDGEAPRGSEASRFCYVTDGPWDIGKFLQMQCLRSAMPIPHDFRPFLNIRRAFVNFYCHGRPGHEAQARMPSTDLCSLLQRLGMQFEGREHSGMDDALNIARVLLQMLEDRAELRVNEKLVRGTKLRDGQKLVFDDNTKAPCRPPPATATASTSAASESSSSNEKFVRAEMAASFAKKFSSGSSSSKVQLQEGKEQQENGHDDGDVTVWKKWWDPLAYKLVKISRQEFLGEQHQECESCDDEGEDEREEDEDEQW